MILITGATEYFGNATIDCLLVKGARLGTIAAFVRDKKKGMDLLSKGIILRTGDFDNYASLVDAFEDVDKLLLVSGTAPENRLKQHENAIRAAKEADVKHIFYTHYEPDYEPGNSSAAFPPHICSCAENIIKESGIRYTIFRNDNYIDTPPFHLGENVSETETVFSRGNVPASFSLYDEMAEATANLLMSEGHENKEYYLSHPEGVPCANAQMY